MRFTKGSNHSDQTKKKISEKNRGRISPMKGKKSTRIGYKHSKETIEKIKKGNIGKKLSQETKNKIKIAKLELFSRTVHHRYKGGITRDKHGNYKSRLWRAKVFERDNWTCQTCHLRGVYLEAHHIKSWAHYPDFRYELNNGVTLCLPCHKLTDNYKGKGVQK